MRKVLCLIVVCLLCVGMCRPVTADEIAPIPTISDDECMDFLNQHGIAIPAGYDKAEDCIPFVRHVLTKLNDDPDTVFVFNATALVDFAREIKCAYWEANNYNPIMSRTMTESTSNILRYNEVVGTWSDAYELYNCYGYAIDYIGRLNPGCLWWENTGNDPDTYIFNLSANVNALADLVCLDLESLGYTVVSSGTTEPNVTVNEHSRLICIRKDKDGGDFHLMRLDDDGKWYHKPGLTNPLRYTSVLSSSYVWIMEAYGMNAAGDALMYYRDPDWTYDSIIYFIAYTMPHTYNRYTYYGQVNGVHHHIKTCADCDATTGSSASCIFKSNNICMICGYNKNAVSTASVIPFEKVV